VQIAEAAVKEIEATITQLREEAKKKKSRSKKRKNPKI